jgi:uncharacterized protein involved in exopolysaccharide biosynthesis
MSGRARPWTDGRWRTDLTRRILTTSDIDARKRTVELTKGPGAVEDTHQELEQARQLADDLATLLAHEHRRAVAEQARREAAEAAAAELAQLLANEHADLERERAARAYAEAQAAELAGVTGEKPRSPRFANVHRSAPRTRPPLQRVL